MALVWVPADFHDDLPTSWWLLDTCCNSRFIRAEPYIPGVQPGQARRETTDPDSIRPTHARKA